MQLVAPLSNFGILFREVPDSRKGFETLAEEISEELSFYNQIKSVLFKNHLFFIAGVKLKFRFERLRNKLRSSTFDNCEITAWSSEICLFQATTGKTSLRTSCLYIRNGKLDTKWRSSKTKSRKENSRTALDGKFIT